MKKILLLIAFLGLISSLKAQTFIDNNTEVKGVWEKEKSPYIIKGLAIIPEGEELIIQPGVIIKLQTGEDYNYYDDFIDVGTIWVKGTLIAVGGRNNPIEFIRNGNSGECGVIAVDETASTKTEFRYCNFDNCGKNKRLTGADDLKGGLIIYKNLKEIKVSDCFFSNCYIGIDIWYSNPKIENCNFSKNVIGGRIEDSPESVVINNNFVKSSMLGLLLSTYKKENFTISNSIFLENERNFELRYYQYSLKNCLIDKVNENARLSVEECIVNKSPQFIDLNNNDFHLKPNSPCIDTGDPTSDFSNEPAPNGGRINIGAYGNTEEATSFSASPRIDNISIDIHALGFDTISINGKYFLDNKGVGKVTLNNKETLQYLSWNDTLIKVISFPTAQENIELSVIDNNGLVGTKDYGIQIHAPSIENINRLSSSLSAGDTLTITGNYFGAIQRNTNLYFAEQISIKYIQWSDTLISVIIPANGEGLKELIFKQDSLTFKTGTNYLYSSKPIVELCGTLEDTLTNENTYLLTCDCEVLAGKTLTIEPGVLIIADHNANNKVQLEINGTLNAIGTFDEPIIFKTLISGNELWNGIVFDSWGTRSLEYVNISNAPSAVTQQDGILIIDHCKFNFNENGIYLDGDREYITTNISNTICTDNNIGIYASAYCNKDDGRVTATIDNCIVKNNSEKGIYIYSGGGTSGLTSSSSGSSVHFTLRNSIVNNNTGYAIDMYSSGYWRDGTPVDLYRYASVDFTSNNSLIFNNEKGINTGRNDVEFSNIKVKIINSNLFKNNTTFTLDADEWFIQNSNLWDNNYSNTPTGDCDSLVVNNSNLNSLDWITHGRNNISVNPQYLSPATGDFHLQPTSLCIDAGSNDIVNFEKDFDGLVRIWDGNNDGTATVDIGAFEYGSILEMAPEITSQPIGGDYCEGNRVELSISVVASPESEYKWHLNGTEISGATNPTYIISSLVDAKAGSYSCIATNSLGSATSEIAKVVMNPNYTINLEESICKGQEFTIDGQTYTTSQTITLNLTSVTGCDSTVIINLEVIDIPTPTVTIENNNNCEGEITTLTAPTGDYSYLWNTGKTSESIETITGGTYSVTVSQKGCSSTSSNYEVSKKVAPTKPEIGVIGDTEFCEGGKTTLVAPTGLATYEWSNGASEFGIEVTRRGNYKVKVTNANSCTSEWSDIKTITVNDNPEKPTIDVNENTLTSSSTNGNQWYLGQAAINGATNQTYDIAQTGNYSVQVTSAKGCISEISEVVNVWLTSVNDISYQVKVYPNPTTGIIQIEGLLQNENTVVTIFNVMGQKLEQKELNTKESIIDLSTYKKGTYYLSFNNSFKSAVKIIKE